MEQDQYVRLNDKNKVIWGPAPLPYIYTDENGDPHKLRGGDPAELDRLNFRLCEVQELDEDIFQKLDWQVRIKDDVPVVTWKTEFVPDCRNVMKQKIDKQAEQLRSEVVTTEATQPLVYQMKLIEARLLEQAIRNDDPYEVEEFPMLAATLGPDGDTLKEVAARVNEKYEIMRERFSEIEKVRRVSKAQIDDARTHQEAFNVYVNAWT